MQKTHTRTCDLYGFRNDSKTCLLFDHDCNYLYVQYLYWEISKEKLIERPNLVAAFRLKSIKPQMSEATKNLIQEINELPKIEIQ